MSLMQIEETIDCACTRMYKRRKKNVCDDAKKEKKKKKSDSLFIECMWYNHKSCNA